VLWVVCLHPDQAGIVQGAIGDGLVTRASDVSRIVSRLGEMGLVERREDASDRRISRVVATEAGRAAFASTTAAVKQLHRRQLGEISDADIARMTETLTELFWQGADEQSREEAS
jgi:DNA-binding MarR family transcriptional regulator